MQAVRSSAAGSLSVHSALSLGGRMERGHVMRDRGLLVALGVCLLIELLGLQFVNAATDPSDPDEILLEAMGVSPVHKVVSWGFPRFCGLRKAQLSCPQRLDSCGSGTAQRIRRSRLIMSSKVCNPGPKLEPPRLAPRLETDDKTVSNRSPGRHARVDIRAVSHRHKPSRRAGSATSTIRRSRCTAASPFRS